VQQCSNRGFQGFAAIAAASEENWNPGPTGISRMMAGMRVTLAAVAAILTIAVWPHEARAATCGDFSNQAAAQRASDTRDPDGDGIYCADLPCPCSRATSGGTQARHHAAKPRTKSRRCRLRGPLSDPACTPGGYYPRGTRRLICRTGYTALVRDVSESTKDTVYREYGIGRHHRTGQYEIDHLVPLELGGSNAIANLFAQRRRPRPGFREKDQLENAANRAVCDDGGALRPLQRRIARNWTAVYAALVGPLPGASAGNGGRVGF
jgi:hypothetical protein